MASTIYKYTLTGATKFPVNFEYLARRFVKVTLIGVTVRELTLNIDFRFTSKNEIETTQVWTTGEFDTIEIRRVTSATDRLVNFSDGSILRAYDLNIAQIQAIHIAEEGRDVSDSALLNNGVKWNALGLSIGNLKDPIEPQDAATKRYVDSVSERDSAFNQNQLGRTVRAPQGEQVSQMPSAAQRAGKILGFDSSGNPIGMLPASGSGTELALDLINKDKGAEMIEWKRKPLADAVTSLSRMLSAQKVNIWEYQHLVTQKPTMNPDTWDWTPAHLEAIRVCKIAPNKVLYYPGGIYQTTAMLDFGSLVVEGGITASNAGVTIMAAADDILMTKLNSNGFLMHVRLDGANKALWNILVLGNRPTIMKVESVRAKENGFTFGSTQNGSFYSVTSYFCKHSFVFYNGARNLNFYGAGSATSKGPSGVPTTDQSELVFNFDLSDPHGFGMPAIITANGNDRISFFGGIFEYPETIIEMRNKQQSTSDVGRVFFYGSEFAGRGKILSTDTLPSMSSPKLIFNNCEFTWGDQDIPFSTGTRGILEFQGETSMSGGALLPNRGISQVNNFDQRGIRVQDNTQFVGGPTGPSTVPKYGFSRPATTGNIAGAVSFTANFKEAFFVDGNVGSLVATGGTAYRTVKGTVPESMTYALTAGISTIGAYTPNGVGAFPLGVASLVENLGNGPSDAALMAFRVRSGGGNNFAYMGVTGGAFVLGTRTGANYQERLNISDRGHICAGVDNQQNLGRADMRFGIVWAGTGTINTSDARLKADIRPLGVRERAVAIKLKDAIRAFKYTDSVEIKGEFARIHFGVVAQEVVSIFASEGLDANDYALLCYDKWNAEYEDVYEVVPILVDGEPVLDELGAPLTEARLTGERREVRAAGDRYGVRLDQINSMIIATLLADIK